jgi:hypothetical protein
VLGAVAERRLLADVHEQLHARADDVRLGQPRDLYDGQQRVLGVRYARGVPELQPKLYWQRQFGSVQLQRDRLHLGCGHVREQLDGRELRAGRLRLPVCHVDLDMQHQRDVRLGFLHGGVRSWADSVCQRHRGSGVRAGRAVGNCDDVRRCVRGHRRRCG